MKKEFDFKKYLHLSPVSVSVVCALFGLLLLIWPTISSAIIAYAIAAVLCVLGGINIFAYFKDDPYVAMTRWVLTTGLALLAVGVALFFLPNWPAYVLPTIWGFTMLAGGLGKVQIAFDLKRMQVSAWWWSLIAATLSLIMGVVTLMNPFGMAMLLMRFIGASLVLEAALDIFFTIYYNRKRKQFYPDKF